MAQEVVTVLKVETGNSEKTIKTLKDEIKNLKNTLENAEIGSEEFAKASEQLAAAQAELKTIMDSTKKTVEAADGSYDALVGTMAKLKKEWRATADEAKRNELGQQIDAINTELKELDATLGNHQRNVGNYKGDIIDAYKEIQGEVKNTNTALSASAKPIDKASEATFDYGKAWGEVQKSTEQTRAKFESVQKVASGLASGMAAVQGAAALLGGENENLQKTFVKVQAAMAIAQGVGGLKDLIEGFTQAKTAFMGATMGLEAMSAESAVATTAMNGTAVATNTATVATSNFKKALISTGIGALVVALGLLIANWDKVSKLWNNTTPQEKAAKANRELEKELSKLAVQSAADKVVRIKELSRAYQNLGDNLKDKKKFVKDYSGELEDMGIKMNDVNDAEKIFRDDTQNYIKAVMARAKADAARKKATEDYAAFLDTLAELEDKKTAATERLTEAQKDYAENGDSYLAKVATAGNRISTTGTAPSISPNQPSNPYEIEVNVAETSLNNIENQIVTATTKAEEQMQNLFDFADEQDAIADKLLGKGKPKGGGSGSSTDPAAEAKTIAERARKSQIDTEKEELAELERIYEKEKALLISHQQDTTALTAEYEDKIKEIKKKYAAAYAEEQKKNGEKEIEKLNKRLANINNVFANSERAINIKYDAKAIGLEEQTTSIMPSLKEEDNIAPIQLEIDKTLELQAVREQAFNEQMAQIQAVLDSGVLTAEQQAELQAEYNAIQQQKIESTADANNQISVLNKELIKQQQADNRQLAQNITTTFTSALNAASSVLSAVQEGIDTTNKEGFEKNKKLQIANATIGMLVGITNAIAGLFTTKSGPWDIALAAMQAGAIATSGAIQIGNIKKQTFDGASGDVGNLNGVGATPNISMADMIPVNYTRELLTDTETTNLNREQRIYVLESDITETQENVSVKEANSSF